MFLEVIANAVVHDPLGGIHQPDTAPVRRASSEQLIELRRFLQLGTLQIAFQLLRGGFQFLAERPIPPWSAPRLRSRRARSLRIELLEQHVQKQRQRVDAEIQTEGHHVPSFLQLREDRQIQLCAGERGRIQLDQLFLLERLHQIVSVGLGGAFAQLAAQRFRRRFASASPLRAHFRIAAGCARRSHSPAGL